jgi:hypothetical protein
MGVADTSLRNRPPRLILPFAFTDTEPRAAAGPTRHGDDARQPARSGRGLPRVPTTPTEPRRAHPFTPFPRPLRGHVSNGERPRTHATCSARPHGIPLDVASARARPVAVRGAHTEKRSRRGPTGARQLRGAGRRRCRAVGRAATFPLGICVGPAREPAAWSLSRPRAPVATFSPFFLLRRMDLVRRLGSACRHGAGERGPPFAPSPTTPHLSFVPGLVAIELCSEDSCVYYKTFGLRLLIIHVFNYTV